MTLFMISEMVLSFLPIQTVNLTIKVGTKNAFNYHGSSHGTLFKDGNSFEIKVNGSTKITLGGCQYSQSGSITASSADGSYTETKEAKTKDCYHNASNYTNEDDYSVSFNYTGETATTITISFTGQTYVPCLSVKSLKKFYDFRDGSIVPTDTDGKKDISYGGLTIKVGTKNAFKYNDAAHGVRFNDGNALEIAVSGPTKITLRMPVFSHRYYNCHKCRLFILLPNSLLLW